jgi:hypothetical protein
MIFHIEAVFLAQYRDTIQYGINKTVAMITTMTISTSTSFFIIIIIIIIVIAQARAHARAQAPSGQKHS